MAKRYKQQQSIRTGVVNNAPGLYWLNISPISGPPTQGNQMTRKGLIELKNQILYVLEGGTGSGFYWDGTKRGKLKLFRRKRSRTKG